VQKKHLNCNIKVPLVVVEKVGFWKGESGGREIDQEM
jgi:hypothetical protein